MTYLLSFLLFISPEDIREFGLTICVLAFVLYYTHRYISLQLSILEKKAEFLFRDKFFHVNGEIDTDESEQPIKIDLIVKQTAHKAE